MLIVDILVVSGILIFICSFILGFITVMIYFRKATNLLGYLHEYHSGKIENLGLPRSLFSIDNTPLRGIKLFKFLQSTDNFGDSTLSSMKTSALKYLKLGLILIVIALIGFFLLSLGISLNK